MKKICALTLVLCFVLALPIFPVFALGEIGSTSYDIKTSDVIEDLSRTYIASKKFDAAEYPLNISADYMLLLNVIEYAWDEYSPGVDKSAYGLYFYLYNPSGDKPLTRGGHQVQMSVSKSDFYVKYLLKLVSASDDNRFLKFKLENADAVLNRLYSDVRTYKISGIEIETAQKGIKDYKIAGTYTFTGKQSSKTLSCKTDILTTLELDIGDTTYRTNTSEIGEHHRNQLDSVYFSIPNWILDKYGNEIYKIRFEMTKKRITGLVTSDKAAYDACRNYIQFYIAPSSLDDFKNSYSESLGWSFATNAINSWIDLRKPVAWNSPAESPLDYVSYFGYISDFDPDETYFVDGDLIKNYWKSYPLRDESCLDIVPKQTYEILIDRPWNSVDYQSTHRFFQRMLDLGLYTAIFGDKVDDTLFNDVKPFESLSMSDLTSMTNDAIASTYYVLERDVDDIKSYVSNAEEQDETTFLFRFNKQDYFSLIGGFQKKRSYGLDLILGDEIDSFYFEQYVYEDFDIMEISFRDEAGIITVLPVVMDPTTIVPDAESPLPDPFGAMGNFKDLFDEPIKKIIGILLMAIAVIVVILVIDKLIPKRVKTTNGSSGRRRRR